MKSWAASAFAAGLFAAVALPAAAAGRSASSAPPSAASIPSAPPSPVVPAVPTIAPGYCAPSAAPPAAQIAGVEQRPFVGITLEEAVRMALLRNPDLAIASSNLDIARDEITEAKAPFDVQLRAGPATSFSVQPPPSAFGGGPGTLSFIAASSATGPVYNPGNVIQHQFSFSYGLGGQAINGLRYRAGILQSRTYNNTLFAVYNPFYLASLDVAITQPLLRDFGINPAKRELELSKVNADAARAQALVDSSNTLSQVEDAYWDLVAAWRNVSIQEEGLKEAVAQQQSDVRLARRGAAAPVDAIESSTQVSNFQEAVFAALEKVAALQNRLKSLIVTNPKAKIWSENLVPTSMPAALPAAPSLQAVVATALENRPELTQARDRREQAEIDAAFAENQLLPQADLSIEYLSNGFAGLPEPQSILPPVASQVCKTDAVTGATLCPQGPPTSRGTMAYAYHNLWAGAYPSFNVSFSVSFPLGNRSARGLAAAAREERYDASVAMQGVKERIEAEARNALQSYQSALARLYAARHARTAAEAVYASELRKFRSGASTTFLVLRRQVQLAQARGQELQAQTDLNEAVVELQRVEGTILTSGAVDLGILGSKAVP